MKTCWLGLLLTMGARSLVVRCWSDAPATRLSSRIQSARVRAPPPMGRTGAFTIVLEPASVVLSAGTSVTIKATSHATAGMARSRCRASVSRPASRSRPWSSREARSPPTWSSPRAPPRPSAPRRATPRTGAMRTSPCATWTYAARAGSSTRPSGQAGARGASSRIVPRPRSPWPSTRAVGPSGRFHRQGRRALARPDAAHRERSSRSPLRKRRQGGPPLFGQGLPRSSTSASIRSVASSPSARRGARRARRASRRQGRARRELRGHRSEARVRVRHAEVHELLPPPLHVRRRHDHRRRVRRPLRGGPRRVTVDPRAGRPLGRGARRARAAIPRRASSASISAVSQIESSFGITRQNVVAPGLVSTSTRPRCASRIPRTIASPRPDPVRSGRFACHVRSYR